MYKSSKFFVVKYNDSTDETITMLTEEGKNELTRLEAMFLPTMSVVKKERYSMYNEVEKLNSLTTKEKREEKKKEMQPKKEKRLSLEDYIITHPDIDWLGMDLKTLEKIECVLNVYLDDIAIAKQIIISDRIENELNNLKQQRVDIDTKIKELEDAKVNILDEAV